MLNDYIASLTKSHKPRTVIFLIKDNKVLLGYKKNGFGKGNYVGIGGKVESNESIQEGAIRELREEINVEVTLENIKEAAVLRFYFPHVKDDSWNQDVYAFIAHEWNGQPTETEEIRPEWFEFDNIPLNKMWDDAKYWTQRVLKGEEVHEEYLFSKDLKVIEYQRFAK